MKLVYTDIPELRSKKPEYAKWKDLLDEFWESGKPSAMVQGITDAYKECNQIRSAINKWYEGRLAACIRNHKVYIRRLVNEEIIG